MAGAHCAPTSFITAFANLNRTPPHTRSLRTVSSLSTPSPSKLSTRKNHLRPKLLKTLKNPYTHLLFPDSTPIQTGTPVELKLEQSPECFSDVEQKESEQDEKHEQLLNCFKESEQDEFLQSETCISEEVSSAGIVDSSNNLFFKGVKFAVGVFVLYQIIESVWFFCFAESKGGTIDSELGTGDNDKSKMEVPLENRKSGIKKDGMVRVDESELAKKIAEIQIMARDTREKEGVNLKEKDVDDDDDDDEEEEEEDYDDDDETLVNSAIKKEVDDRLVVLSKSLKNNRQRPVSIDGVSSKNGNVRNEINAKMANDALMFKKKHKFERFQSDPSDKPKGFQSSDNGSVKRVKSKLVERMDEMLKVEMPDDLDEENSVAVDEYQVSESPVQETKSVSNPSKNLIGGKGSETRGKGFGGRKTSPSAGNMQIKSNVMSIESLSNLKKRSAKKAEPWWWSLKYALVLFMHNSSSGETDEGLYTLHGDSDEAYTIALEDRSDATNLCYIVESWLNTRKKFGVQILPVPIRDLALQIESENGMKLNVLFVKKGALKLYVGQPIEEVELALLSLV